MYSDFPLIEYPFEIDGKTVYKVIRDISVNPKIRSDSLENLSVYRVYYLRDGDTPDVIAQKYYGDSKLYYLVMLANDRFDWRKDFPLTQSELDYYINTKYLHPDDVHHYVDTDGKILDNLTRTDADGDTYLLTSLPDVYFATDDDDIINGILQTFGYEYIVDTVETASTCPCHSGVTTSKTKIQLTRDTVDYLNEHFLQNNPINLSVRKYVDGEHIIPITNREYEENLNEKKRKIRLIDKEYAPSVVSAIKDIIGEG